MPHSFTSSYFHFVFSTKERRSLITPDLQNRLYQYIGGIARKNKIKLIAVGGMPDHVHLLRSLPATMPVSKTMQLIKAGSSKWIHDSFPGHRDFAWQEGYGAFSIGIREIERTRQYIENQEEHHNTRSFEDEFLEFLDRNRVEYDEQDLF